MEVIKSNYINLTSIQLSLLYKQECIDVSTTVLNLSGNRQEVDKKANGSFIENRQQMKSQGQSKTRQRSEAGKAGLTGLGRKPGQVQNKD